MPSHDELARDLSTAPEDTTPAQAVTAPPAERAEPEILTHSRQSCASACLRRHLLRYEIGLTPSEEREDARFGTLYHEALDASDKGESDEQIAARVRSKARNPYEAESVLRLWLGHRWFWQDDRLDVVESEKEFRLPIRNPETGRATPNWINGGKRDAIVRLRDARLALKEYKTTISDISPGSDYWMRLRLDQQVSRYMLAARAEGIDVRTVLYDVTRRPLFRPAKATPPEERRFTEKASKLKDGTVRPAGSLHANQRLNDETPEEFGERVAAAIFEAPATYYVRMEIARTDEDLAEFEQELWEQQRALSECRKHGRWFRNTNACLMPFKCEFLAICAEPGLAQRVADGYVPGGFKLSDNKHPELAASWAAGD